MHIRKPVLKFILSMIHLQGGTPPRILQRSMDADPELRSHWEMEQSLTHSLRIPDDRPCPVPSTLRDRILLKAKRGQQPGRSRRVSLWPALTTGSAMAAVLALGAMIFLMHQEHAPSTPQEQDSVPVIDFTSERPGAPITLQSPIENHSLVKLSALIESPLREEPQRLLNDAGNALKFLSAAFVPSKSLRDEVVESLIGKAPLKPQDGEA